MRRALALIAVLLLAGCSDPAPEPRAEATLPDGNYLIITTIEVNGRTISCVVNTKGGVSCDFTREAT